MRVAKASYKNTADSVHARSYLLFNPNEIKEFQVDSFVLVNNLRTKATPMTRTRKVRWNMKNNLEIDFDFAKKHA